MKKSLLISRYFPPYVGGISSFMGRIAAALGPERVCCLTDMPANGPDNSAGVGVPVYRRPRAFTGAAPVQAASWALTASEIMLRERPTAVQIGTVAEGYLALSLQRWMGLPFVVYVHGNELLSALRASWDKPKLALRQAACVLANSRFTADVVEQAGVPRERITILHPGCDVDLFRPLPPDMAFKRSLLGARADGRVLLTVGGVVPRKGHDMVIRALPTILRTCPDVTYIIASSDPRAFERLDRLAREQGVREAVLLAQGIPDSDLARLYAISDIFVMPSRADLDNCDVEGFGIVFLEASACGRPVVAGNSGGIPDAVLDGVTGLLVDPHSPEAIAHTIVQLLGNPELRAKLGDQGRQRVARELTWTQVAGRVQNLIDTL